MFEVDTSAEAVQALIRQLEGDKFFRLPTVVSDESPATLRALIAERDAAHAAGRKEALEEALKVIRQRMKEWDLADMSNYFNAAAAIERSVSALQHQKGDTDNG